jgi:hypothetical protein
LGAFLLWVIFSWAGAAVLEFSLGLAILGGLAATGLHWLADFCHQLGHAWAARRVGYPMTGVKLGQWLIFSTSQYPTDEPDLLAAIHVRRALGGPAASLLISAAVGILAWLLYPRGGLAWWLALIFCLENLGAGLGAFLPLGFTDGSTLLRLWKQR